MKIGLAFEEDIIPLDKVYWYQNKYYLFDEKLIEKYFYTLIEQGEYDFSEKKEEVLKCYTAAAGKAKGTIKKRKIIKYYGREYLLVFFFL